MHPTRLAKLRDCCRDQAAFEKLQQILAVELEEMQLDQQEALFRVIAKIRESLDLNTIFQATVTEVRQLLEADRVGIFRFYPDSDHNDGEFVSEDVSTEFPSALTTRIHDHCFGEEYAVFYLHGRIQAIADIHRAGLQGCHVNVLSQFQIRANLIVPLLQGDRLWGLLCIHQCTGPREWKESEIEFVSHVANHLGVALQQAELLATIRLQASRRKAVFAVITKIRASLDLDTIFQATAIEVRQLMNADRVGVFQFSADSHYQDGTFVSEDVVPGFNSVLSAHVHDHCFGEYYSLNYLNGRVQATEDIYKAGLQDCHVQILAQFQVRANLVVPLLQGEHLWGLLCIHQCSNSRCWQPTEIEFAVQIASQLGIAIKQAELLSQTRRQSLELIQTLEELRSTQTQLIQHEKMSGLGQLVAGVAHEINNPVNFIYGNLNHANQYAKDLLDLLVLYQQHYPNPDPDLRDRADQIDLEFLREDFPRMLSSMQLGADRIRQIVVSLRNFSRLDEAEKKPVNIHEGLDSTLLILQHRLKVTDDNRSIRVIKEYGDLPLVECYPSQLNQVFMNILTNAIDALEDHDRWIEPSMTIQSPPLRQIKIRTALLPAQDNNIPHVVIRIADTGPGIPEAVQSKLFNPFFTTKPTGKGTGLGLSISYQIVVQRHGGILRCLSYPQRGTEFWIEIPIAQTKRSLNPT